MMKFKEIKTEKIDGFLIYIEHFPDGRIVKTVYQNYVPVVIFHQDLINERKLAAIELVERCRCKHATAGKICGFHRNSVFKYLRIKRLLGIEAVLQDERGPKSPFKYVGETRAQIKKLLRKYPEWTDQQIAEEAGKALKINISRSAVARIRNEKIDENRARDRNISKRELIDLAKEAEIIEIQQREEEQLLLEFKWDAELSRKVAEFEQESDIKGKKESESQWIAKLKKGVRCSFSGNLMHHLFLEEIGFKELCGVFPVKSGACYQPCDILLTLFHSIDLGLKSIESLKLINASDMGVLAGLNRIPDKEVVRDYLEEMGEANKSGALIDAFARKVLDLGRIDREVFFIDGHFLPYYGLNVIAKGYYTVRRLAMRGNELYAVTDLQGRPLFFITESNEIDFRPMIERCAQKLQEYGIVRPMLVFDRGGYGVHFFTELDKAADFVTWTKYVSEKELQGFDANEFQAGVIVGKGRYHVGEMQRQVSESIQNAKKGGRTVASSIGLRMVVIEDLDTGKRMGIYTNNHIRPCWDIAFYMLNRWADSENHYKEMMARFNLNYHPGYDIQELENQPLVDNPDVELIKKALKTLKKENLEIKEEIEYLSLKIEKQSDKRLVNKRLKLMALLDEKQMDINGFESKLKSLPEKVSIVELLKGKVMSRCDLEKKRLYDWVQFMAYHSRERLVDIFRESYDDKRDIKKVLDMITSRGGYIRLAGQTLVVLLDWIENKKHRLAAQSLCRSLNQKGLKTAGRLDLKLFFHMASVPNLKIIGNYSATIY